MEFSGHPFQHVHRRTSPKQLPLRARSLAPRASPRPHLPLSVPAEVNKNLVLIKEELEVPYEIKYYQRDANQLAPKELLDVNPLGKAPVITDGDVTLAESGVIIRAYLFTLCFWA